MARKTDDLEAVSEFLSTAVKDMVPTDENGEYIEKAKEYSERLKQKDAGVDCFISVLHIVKGIMILDIGNGTCLIVADNERSVRDFMRCIPNNV